jgi:tetratricopeptide (TPR) repeat protein
MLRRTTVLPPTGFAEPATSSYRWSIIFAGTIIVLAALAAYHNSFAVPFLFDDPLSIAQNASIRHLWPIWDALSPPATSFVGGRAVLNFSFALNYALGGLAVWGYHAVNLAIHILAGLTLYGIVRRTLLRPSLRERFGASAPGLALAVAILWTVHPLQTEAVTYVSERAESLMGLLYLLTLYCFVRGTDSPNSGYWFALSVGVCLLGMASKEVMVTAPVMTLLYDRTFVSGSFREAWRRHRQLYLGLAGTWLFLGYQMVGLHYRDAGYGLGITWWAYSFGECRVVVNYLWLALWPHPLVFDYGQFVTIRHIAEMVPYALVLVVLAASVLFALWRRPAIGFVGAWFFMILAPTSSVVPVGGQPMAEHRMYLPLAAVVTVVVIGIDGLLGRRRVAVFLAAAVGLGVLTARRNEDYRTEVSIWNDTVAKCPENARAHNNLGWDLLEAGQLPAAMAQCERALRIQPDYAEAHNNLGIALRQAGKIEDAIGHYEHALRVRPDFAEAHYNLGIALEQVGKIEDAIGHYEQALRVKPDYAGAHNNLGNALVHGGKIEDAIGHYEQALRVKPDFAEAHYNLGTVFLQEGKISDAIEHYEQALRIKPDYASAHNNLGDALRQMGKIEDAIGHYQQALRIKPDYAEAHYGLGIALEQVGNVPEAIAHYEQALRIRPDYTEARDALGRLQVRQ